MFLYMSNIFGPFWVVTKCTKKIQSLCIEHDLSLAEMVMKATLPEPFFSTWVIHGGYNDNLANLAGILITFDEEERHSPSSNT